MRIPPLILLAVILGLDLSRPALPATLTKPLLPILFRVNAPDAQYPDYTTSELDLILGQSRGLWGSDTNLPTGNDLTYLKSRNQNYVVIAYLNGGAEGGWPQSGPQLEDDRLNYIQVYRATKLSANISVTTTQIKVDNAAQIPATGGAVDPRTAVHSLDGRTGANGGFISFIRIDNEIMRVTAKGNTNPPTLTVIRGTDGTTPVKHNAGAPVLGPVYVTDYNPDGLLTVQDGMVRYSLNVGTPQLANLLATTFVATYVQGGWDGVWLDLTAPSFYNMVDAKNLEIDGETRFPYNTVAREDYTYSSRAYHHDLKIGRIQTAIQAEFGSLPFIAVNNNADGKWFSDRGYGRRFAEDNPAKIQAVDGVSLESPFAKPSDAPAHFEWKGLSSWKKNARSVADATNRGYSVVPWLKMVAGADYVPENMDRPLAFSWASVLLSWGPQAAASAVVLELWTKKDGGGRRIALPDFMYYDMGDPIGQGPATDDALDALLVGSTTYKRDWTKGTILVNPADSSDNGVSVSGYVDPVTCRPVQITSMPAQSYKFLMLPGACN